MRENTIEFQNELLKVLKSIAKSEKRIADFYDSIYKTQQGRIGTYDLATHTNSKLIAVLLKSMQLEAQKQTAMQKVQS